jgi:hypothetical protein
MLQDAALVRQENTDLLLFEDWLAEVEERARPRLISAYKAQPTIERGSLIARWTDVGFEWDEQEIAEFRLECSYDYVRVLKWRALAVRPCGEALRRCARLPDCAHQYGAKVEDRIVNAVFADLMAEDEIVRGIVSALPSLVASKHAVRLIGRSASRTNRA